MQDKDSGAGIVRVLGVWFIVAGMLVGLVAAGRPHIGYLFVAALLVLVGVGLRIEAAIRNADRTADASSVTRHEAA